MRALGDPLFLKEAYGRGYQLHVVVKKSNCSEVSNIVSDILPNSKVTEGFSVDDNLAEAADDALITLSVAVPRGDLRGFPRLFSWLENSKRAAQLVKEWGVSNTTLEEVFLQLCIQNREINYTGADSDGADESTIFMLCPMCRMNRRSDVVCLRSTSGQLMAVPDALCEECASGNEFFSISEATAMSLKLIPLLEAACSDIDATVQISDETTRKRIEFLADAHSRSEAATTRRLIALEIDIDPGTRNIVEDRAAFNEEWEQAETVDEIGIESPMKPIDSIVRGCELSVNFADTDACGFRTSHDDFGLLQDFGETMAAGVPKRTDARRAEYYGSSTAQVNALIIKNVRLQYRQRCSNICSVFFVGVLFLMLYIMSLLFGASDSLEQCGQGYVTDRDCSTRVLVDHIFSADDGSMSDDYATDDNELGPNGYNIQYYLAPVVMFKCLRNLGMLAMYPA